MFFKNAITELINYIWPMIIIVVTMLVFLRLSYILIHKKKIEIYKELINLGFIIYILSLFYIVTLQDVNYGTSNFIPFKEITRYDIGSKLFYKNVIGNIILFIPLGFFISYYIKPKNIIIPAFLIIFFSSVIEFTQDKIGRTFDIDDITLNVIGGIIGYTLYKLYGFLPKFTRKTWFLNTVCIIIVIAFVLYLLNIYGVINGW